MECLKAKVNNLRVNTNALKVSRHAREFTSSCLYDQISNTHNPISHIVALQSSLGYNDEVKMFLHIHTMHHMWV